MNESLDVSKSLILQLEKIIKDRLLSEKDYHSNINDTIDKLGGIVNQLFMQNYTHTQLFELIGGLTYNLKNMLNYLRRDSNYIVNFSFIAGFTNFLHYNLLTTSTLTDAILFSSSNILADILTGLVDVPHEIITLIKTSPIEEILIKNNIVKLLEISADIYQILAKKIPRCSDVDLRTWINKSLMAVNLNFELWGNAEHIEMYKEGRLDRIQFENLVTTYLPSFVSIIGMMNTVLGIYNTNYKEIVKIKEQYYPLDRLTGRLETILMHSDKLMNYYKSQTNKGRVDFGIKSYPLLKMHYKHHIRKYQYYQKVSTEFPDENLINSSRDMLQSFMKSEYGDPLNSPFSTTMNELVIEIASWCITHNISDVLVDNYIGIIDGEKNPADLQLIMCLYKLNNNNNNLIQNKHENNENILETMQNYKNNKPYERDFNNLKEFVETTKFNDTIIERERKLFDPLTWIFKINNTPFMIYNIQESKIR